MSRYVVIFFDTVVCRQAVDIIVEMSLSIYIYVLVMSAIGEVYCGNVGE